MYVYCKERNNLRSFFFYGKFLIILFIMKEVYHGMSFAGIG